jgi:hypothetical protein
MTTNARTTPSTRGIAQAQQTIAALAAAQQRANRLTLIVGLLSIFVISGYFYVVYQRLSEYVQPEAIVDIGQNMLEERWPDAREAVESHVKTSAPEWAAQLSDQAVLTLPQAREYLQNFALERTDELAVEAVALSKERIRELVRNQRALFQETFQQLAKSPEEAQSRLEELRKHFEDQMGADFETQMKQVLHTADEMNEKLATLKAGTDLTPEQQIERRILMLARRLQNDQVPVSVATSGGE